MSNYTKFQQLCDLYELLDIDFDLLYDCEQNADGSWDASIEEDGKLLHGSEIGHGDTKEEALNDAADRFINHTPMVDNVPMRKLLQLLELKLKKVET